MDIKKRYDKNYGKWFLGDVRRAIETYGLIEEGDKICVALSGGRDSSVLLYILWYLTEYSHLKFDLSALHVRTGDYDTTVLGDFCSELGIAYRESRLEFGQGIPERKICYICSRLKRGAISDVLKQQGIRKIAYGHHADDVAETFFMNIIQNKKLGSFSPRVEYDDNDMIIIRPMVYLDEHRIAGIHRHAGLPVLAYTCPHEAESLRSRYRDALSEVNDLFSTRRFSVRLVQALENIDHANVWGDLMVR